MREETRLEGTEDKDTCPFLNLGRDVSWSVSDTMPSLNRGREESRPPRLVNRNKSRITQCDRTKEKSKLKQKIPLSTYLQK